MAQEVYRIEIPIEVDDKTAQALQQAGMRITKFEKSVERTEKQLQKVSRTKWQLTLHALDRASHVIRRVGSAAKRVASGAYHITLRVTDLATRPLRAIGRLATSTAGLLGAGIALGGPMFMIGGAIRTAAEFEQQMANVRAVTGATGEDFQRLTERARELGATMPFTTSQVADAMGFLGMAGFTVEQILAGIEPTLLLASAGMLDLGEAADIATNVLSGMRMEVDQLQRVVDVMAATAASANTTVSQMGLALSYAAPAAADAGVALEEVSAAIGFLGNAGIQGERAGTALRQMLLQLNNASGPVSKRLKEMGLNLWDAKGAFVGIIPFMEQVEKRGLRLADVANAFGTETAGAVSILLNMGSKSFKEYVKQLENASGRAEEMAAIQEGTFLGSIRKLQSAWESLNITLGTQQIPGLQRLVDLLTEGMVNSDGLAHSIGETLNNAFNQMADWIEEIQSDPRFQELNFFGKVEFIFEDIYQRSMEWWNSTGAPALENWWENTGRPWFKSTGKDMLLALYEGAKAVTPTVMNTIGRDIMNFMIATLERGFGVNLPGGRTGQEILEDKLQIADATRRKIRGYATGGIVTQPQLATVAETGPEAIIPLTGNRARGVMLWQEAGRQLGVSQGVPQNHNGRNLVVNVNIDNININNKTDENALLYRIGHAVAEALGNMP